MNMDYGKFFGKKLVRGVLIVVLCIVVLHIGLTVWANLKLRAAMKNAADVRMKRSELIPEPIPEGYNASKYMSAAGELLTLENQERDAMRENWPNLMQTTSLPSGKGYDLLSHIVDRNESFYTVIEDVLDCDKAWFSFDYENDPPFGTKIPNFLAHQHAAYALRAAALVSMYERRPDEAFGHCRTMLRYGSMTSIETPTLIGSLVGVAVGSMGTDTLQLIMNRHTPNDLERDLLKAELELAKESTDMIMNWEGEITEHVYGMEHIIRGGDFDFMGDVGNVLGNRLVLFALRHPFRFFLRANEAVMVDAFRTIIECYKSSPWEGSQRLKEMDLAEHLPRYALLARIALPNAAKALERRNAFHAKVDLCYIALLLEDYREQHGSYPGQLTQLMSDITDKLPLDPFSGGNYIYRKEGDGFLMYSVSGNRQDEGGSIPNPKNPIRTGDIVWRKD